ncbi:MAG TPA: class I SAM-dependent methyltransferase, partial [Methanomassiliicoccales archaeon]|nr:class I SAM-dependent methyltransferase [Methanomassiliicoccales archaeon]
MNGKKVQEVFGKRAEGYVTSASHADQEVLERVGRLCGDLRGRTALDLATGTGHVAMQLAPLAGVVVGLDLTRRMLELA